MLSSMHPLKKTELVSADYWETRGSGAEDNKSVVWRNPNFDIVERKHCDYLSTICRGKDILDIGAGWGRFGEKLAGVYKSYTGIERSSSMAARAPAGVKVHVGSGTEMPFQSEQFDVAFMVMCMGVLVEKDSSKIYHEAMRCLRKDGVFVILQAYATTIFEREDYDFLG